MKKIKNIIKKLYLSSFLVLTTATVFIPQQVKAQGEDKVLDAIRLTLSDEGVWRENLENLEQAIEIFNANKNNEAVQKAYLNILCTLYQKFIQNKLRLQQNDVKRILFAFMIFSAEQNLVQRYKNESLSRSRQIHTDGATEEIFNFYNQQFNRRANPQTLLEEMTQYQQQLVQRNEEVPEFEEEEVSEFEGEVSEFEFLGEEVSPDNEDDIVFGMPGPEQQNHMPRSMITDPVEQFKQAIIDLGQRIHHQIRNNQPLETPQIITLIQTIEGINEELPDNLEENILKNLAQMYLDNILQPLYSYFDSHTISQDDLNIIKQAFQKLLDDKSIKLLPPNYKFNNSVTLNTAINRIFTYQPLEQKNFDDKDFEDLIKNLAQAQLTLLEFQKQQQKKKKEKITEIKQLPKKVDWNTLKQFAKGFAEEGNKPTCPICYDKVLDTVGTNVTVHQCGYINCEKCANQWAKAEWTTTLQLEDGRDLVFDYDNKKKTCPSCRKKTEGNTYNFTIVSSEKEEEDQNNDDNVIFDDRPVTQDQRPRSMSLEKQLVEAIKKLEQLILPRIQNHQPLNTSQITRQIQTINEIHEELPPNLEEDILKNLAQIYLENILKPLYSYFDSHPISEGDLNIIKQAFQKLLDDKSIKLLPPNYKFYKDITLSTAINRILQFQPLPQDLIEEHFAQILQERPNTPVVAPVTQRRNIVPNPAPTTNSDLGRNTPRQNNPVVVPTRIPVQRRNVANQRGLNRNHTVVLNPVKKASDYEIGRIKKLIQQKRFLKIHTILSKYFKELDTVLSKEKIQNSDPQEIIKIIETLLNQLNENN